MLKKIKKFFSKKAYLGATTHQSINKGLTHILFKLSDERIDTNFINILKRTYVFYTFFYMEDTFT